MSITIWPHGWSFQMFLAGLAVLLVGGIAGGWTGIHCYMQGWDDAKAVYGPHAHPNPNTADNHNERQIP